MTSYADNVSSHNLANLSIAEREAIENHKQECLRRWNLAKEHASQIYFGLNARKGRIWAERELQSRPEIEKETRNQLNALLKAKR